MFAQAVEHSSRLFRKTVRQPPWKATPQSRGQMAQRGEAPHPEGSARIGASSPDLAFAN